jgi:hypothetical protein
LFRGFPCSFEGGAEARDGLTIFDAKIAGHFSF